MTSVFPPFLQAILLESQFFEVQLCHASTSPTRLALRSTREPPTGVIRVRGKRIRHRKNNTSKTFEVQKKKSFVQKDSHLNPATTNWTTSHSQCAEDDEADGVWVSQFASSLEVRVNTPLSRRRNAKHASNHHPPSTWWTGWEKKHSSDITNCGSHRCCEPLQTIVQCRVAERQTDELGLNVCFWRNV